MNQNTDGSWQEARSMWLASLSENTQLAYSRALQQLLTFTGMQPYQVGRREIADWMASLRRRSCTNETITARVSAVSSFYKFVINDYQVIGDNGSRIILRSDNPAAGGTRPKITKFGKAFALDVPQTRALLKAIDRSRAIGKRDYALFLGYLMTGRRNSEWRTLRYEDMAEDFTGAKFRWTGKGKRDQLQDLNPPVLEAINDYAAAENRNSGYVFHSYLASGVIVERPVSSGYARRALKYYAAKAGLRTDLLHVHTLRHTAAVLRHEAGDDPEQIRELLGHESLSTTQIYLQRLKKRPDDTWQTVAEYLGL